MFLYSTLLEWDKINQVLDELLKKKEGKSIDQVSHSLAYSQSKWNALSTVYLKYLESYTQPIREIPEDHLDKLYSYMVHSTKIFGGVWQGKKTHRIHLITPILFHVAMLFGPEDPIKIAIEEDLN